MVVRLKDYLKENLFSYFLICLFVAFILGLRYKVLSFLPSTIVTRIVLPLTLIVVVMLLVKIISITLQSYFHRASQKFRVDETKYAIFTKVVIAVVYFIGFSFIIYSIPELRTVSYSLFAGAGILAVIIGFATQQVFANIVSGIFLALFQPFRVGDVIKVADEIGTVEDLTLRHTVIKTFDSRRVIIPNAKLSVDPIINYSIGEARIVKSFDIPLKLDANIDQVREIIIDEIEKHPDYISTLHDTTLGELEKIPKVKVAEIRDWSIIIRASFWAKDINVAGRMTFDVLENVKKRLDEKNIKKSSRLISKKKKKR
jgi:small conductance mechanosensitive channel